MVSHLHLHHLVFALRAERPLIGQGIVVVGALVAVQRDGVPWQLDDLNYVTGKNWLLFTCISVIQLQRIVV